MFHSYIKLPGGNYNSWPYGGLIRIIYIYIHLWYCILYIYIILYYIILYYIVLYYIIFYSILLYIYIYILLYTYIYICMYVLYILYIDYILYILYIICILYYIYHIYIYIDGVESWGIQKKIWWCAFNTYRIIGIGSKLVIPILRKVNIQLPPIFMFSKITGFSPIPTWFSYYVKNLFRKWDDVYWLLLGLAHKKKCLAVQGLPSSKPTSICKECRSFPTKNPGFPQLS